VAGRGGQMKNSPKHQQERDPEGDGRLKTEMNNSRGRLIRGKKGREGKLISPVGGVTDQKSLGGQGEIANIKGKSPQAEKKA